MSTDSFVKQCLVVLVLGGLIASGAQHMHTVRVHADSVPIVSQDTIDAGQGQVTTPVPEMQEAVSPTASGSVSAEAHSQPVAGSSNDTQFSQSTPNDTANLSDPPRKVIIELNDGILRIPYRDTGETRWQFAHTPAQPAEIREKNLRGANLSQMSIAGITLLACELDNILANDVVATGATLESCNAQGGKWQFADFSSATISRPKFIGLSFERAKFHSATLRYGEYWNCNFEGVDLRDAVLDGARFTNCSFKGVRFNCRMGNNPLQFLMCNFRGADLSKLRPSGLGFGECKKDATTKFPPSFDARTISNGFVDD